MGFESMIIRRAENRDSEGIWDLLHADCKGWSEEQIHNNLPHLLVLTKYGKLLGVLFGELILDKAEIIWIVIHPFYPEESLKQMLIQGLKGTRYQTENSPKVSVPAGKAGNKCKLIAD